MLKSPQINEKQMGAYEIIQKRVLEALPRRNRIEIKIDFKGSFPAAMPVKCCIFYSLFGGHPWE